MMKFQLSYLENILIKWVDLNEAIHLVFSWTNKAALKLYLILFIDMKVEKIDRSFLIDDIKRLKINCQMIWLFLVITIKEKKFIRFADFTGDSLKLSVLLHQIKVNL